jgi:tetratricopeptide (TPR) repeat protein
VNLNKSYGLILLIAAFSLNCGTQQSVKKTDSKTNPEQLREKFSRVYVNATSKKLAGKNEDAVRLFKRSASILPSEHAPYYQLALIYKSESKYDSALMYAKKALQGDSKNKWYRELGADLYWINLNRKTSTSMYEKLISDYPGTRTYYDRLQNMYRRMGDRNAEISVVSKRLDYFGYDQNYTVHLEQLLSSSGKTDEAIKLWKDRISIDPKDLISYKRLGALYNKTGDTKTAFSYYQKGMTHADGDVAMTQSYLHFLKTNNYQAQFDALANQIISDAGASQKLKKYLFDLTTDKTQKLKLGDQLIESGQANDDLVTSVGLMHFKVGHFQKAFESLNQLDDPLSLDVSITLAKAGLESKNSSQALKRILAVREVYPFNSDLKTHLNVLLAWVDPDSFSAAFIPKNTTADRLTLYLAYARSGKNLDEIQVEKNYNEKDETVLYFLSKALLESQNGELALSFMKKISENHSGSYFELLGDIYLATGDPIRAKKEWENALKIGWDNQLFLQKLNNEQ